MFYCHCFKCFSQKLYVCYVPHYKTNHSNGNTFFLLMLETLNGIFIPFLYNGTYFKCIKMENITTRETRGTMMPTIIDKASLKININKELKIIE